MKAQVATALTPAMRDLLWSLVRHGRHVRGSEVQTARRLEKLGVVFLEDNGSLKPCGREDGERWYASVTDQEYAQAILENAQ